MKRRTKHSLLLLEDISLMRLLYCVSILVLNFNLNKCNIEKNYSWNEMSYLDKKRKVKNGVKIMLRISLDIRSYVSIRRESNRRHNQSTYR